MSRPLHLDTHVAAWLYAGLHDALSQPLRQRISTDPLLVSPMVRLELTFLHEVGRLSPPASRVLAELSRSIGLAEDDTSFREVIATAEQFSWTRDPFDRVIAAQAVAADGDLATKDRTIRRYLPGRTVWD